MTKEEFKDAFERYFDSVRSYIYYRCGDGDLATDIAQEAFLKVWEKQLPYEMRQIKGLVYKIAGDLFISHYRRQKVASRYEKEMTLGFETGSVDHTLEFEELKKHYERALGQLPEKQRVVFLMSRQEGLKYSEIAERLDLSVKAVEKRMNLALSYLKKALNRNG